MIKVRNPRSGVVDFEFEPPDPARLAAMAQRLRAAQGTWSGQAIERRVEVLRRWRQSLEAGREAIVAALSVDTGRHLIAQAEFNGVLAAIDRWSRLAPALVREEQGRSTELPTIDYRTQLVPYPLVGVISPWNFPLTLSLIDAIPALLAGCAVLVKPSEVAPRFSVPLRASIESVPELAAVLEFVPGDGRTGSELIPRVDAVCFTGSVRTGRLVAQAAAKHFIPAFLELGGKDPVIVTGSADLERATDVVLRASVLASGQACQSLERVYVHESIYERFVQRLTEKASAVGINYPDLHAGVVGPLIFDRQADTIASQLDDAVQKGARILCGGLVEIHDGGCWVRPTVVVDVHHGMTLMTEETFGPVMPVMRYRSDDEAVALANDSSYGLSAAVIAGTLDEAEAIGRRLDAGAVSLNDGALTGVMHEAEKNSFKSSGLGGSRMGPAGLTRFLRRKALIRQSGAPATIGMFDEAVGARVAGSGSRQGGGPDSVPGPSGTRTRNPGTDFDPS
jgi:acyl-CoA reductase-like NAD-dependent aldehyde dehydrogenase